MIFTYLPFYFNLSFPVFFHSSVLLHPDLHTDLDNLDSVENNLRHSAKGSLDAYDVIESLTGYELKRIELNQILVNQQNQIIDDQDDIAQIGVKPLSYSQSLIHSAYDSAEGIATPPDSDLEDEQLRKMAASPLYFQEREENEGQARSYHSEREGLMINSSRNPEVSGKLDAECVQKREANSQRTQAHHSKRESLIASSSRDLEVSGKPDAVFSRHSESSQNTFSRRDRSNELGNRFESSVHSVSLHDGNKDHLLNQARSELMKQEHQIS